MLNIGEYLIYKNDVYIIDNIEKNNDLGKIYYSLKSISDNSLHIKIPIDTNKKYLRHIMKKDEAINFMNRIKFIDKINSNKLTEVDYKSLLFTYNIDNLVKILKSSYKEIYKRKLLGKKERELDENYFNISLNLLTNELSISLETNKEEIKDYIIEQIKF